MADIIYFNSYNVIDPSKLRNNTVKLDSTLIAPAKEEVQADIVQEHSAEPIKNMEDIMRISDYLIASERYRDNMLFILGINFGLRVSDLVKLRFSDLINDNLTFKDTFPVFEQKTRNTRKKKKNRYITINTAVIEAVTLFLENTSDVCLSDYLFRSESTKDYNRNSPLHRSSVDRILKSIADDLDLNMRVSTHTLRKTFCYHQMVMSNNDPRKLLLLSKMMGHSSIAITLDYIGITGEEIEDAYRHLNLGSKEHSYLNSDFGECEPLMVG